MGDAAVDNATGEKGGREAVVEAAAVAVAAAAPEEHSSSGAGRLRALAMEACVQAGEWETALTLFDAVRRVGAMPGATEWRAAMSAFAAGGLWQRALAALPIMNRAGVGAGAEELSHAAAACISAGQWHAFDAVLSACARGEAADGGLALVTVRALQTCRDPQSITRVLSLLQTTEADHVRRVGIDAGRT